jgi:hypothetical protein
MSEMGNEKYIKSLQEFIVRLNDEIKRWPKCKGHEMPKEAELIKELSEAHALIDDAEKAIDLTIGAFGPFPQELKEILVKIKAWKGTVKENLTVQKDLK